MKKKIILFIVVAMIVVATFSLIGGAPPSKPKGPKITISAAPTDTFTVDDIPPVITITGDNPVTIAVGDNWVDAKMLEVAGLGIAFNPKDEVVKAVAQVLIVGERHQTIVSEVLKWSKGRSQD